MLRLVSKMSGRRFGRGVVMPGGVSALQRIGPAQILAELARLENAVTARSRLGRRDPHGDIQAATMDLRDLW